MISCKDVPNCFSTRRATKRLIISSHGAIAYKYPKFSQINVKLCFVAQGNRSTKGKVSSVIYMTDRDFIREDVGTIQIDRHVLTFYENDTEQEIAECLDSGYDVITIKDHMKVTLGGIL